MNKQTFIIPIDFSEATESALKFGLKMAEKNDDNIILIHIVKSEEDCHSAELKLDQLISDNYSANKDNIISKVIVGKAVNDIGTLSEVSGASFIIMGTHREKGFDRFFGSNALKTITQSKVPFIVLQKETTYQDISKVAMTIDLEKESVQIVKIAAALSSKFNSEVVLVGGLHTDPLLKQKGQANMKIALRYLQDKGVKASVEFLDRHNFEDNLINYCQNNGVNMIAATYYPDTFHMLSEKFVQHLLENELKIPVLTIDAMAVTKGSQYSFISV